MESNYTISVGNTFDFPLNDIIKDHSEYYPELKTITIEEMEKLREISSKECFDFSGIQSYYISELEDGCWIYEPTDVISETIVEHLIDWLFDLRGDN